ncbi:MAG TPA: ABC transporter substrate-binding protein [Bacilli bacterium]
MKNRFVFLLAMLAVLLTASVALAGCGNKTGGENADSNKPVVENSNGDNSGGEKSETVKIGIIQYAEHPSLDAATNGFIAALKDNGYEEGKNLQIDLQIAQADPATNQTIAQKFKGDNLDLILANATPSAQVVAKAITDVPILFTSVTDPVSAKLVASPEKPGGNVTGTSDFPPNIIDKLMDFVKSEFPQVKTMGIVYNPGETNSVVQVEKAKEVLSAKGIEVKMAAAANTNEVKQAAESLVGSVQAIFVPTDNTVVEALESVIQVANENKLPLFVGEKDSVKRGGFAAYSVDYYNLGYTTGKMAVDILQNGKKPADIPVGYPEKLDLMLNLQAAEKMGITVTDSMKSKVANPDTDILQ